MRDARRRRFLQAAGVLLIHTDESATYPWGTVQGSASGPQVRLETLLGFGW